jgi:D-amino-acid dehydrogenase
MLEAGAAIRALLDSSRALYPALIAEQSLACEWETKGLLHVYRSETELEEHGRMDRLTRAEFGLGATRIGSDELSAFEPALKPGLAGGWWYPEDAHLKPDLLLDSWYQALERTGVALRPGLEVTSFVRSNGIARAVRTTAGDLEADGFVVATGSWTPRLAKDLGARVPIQPAKGYSITMARPDRCPTRPLLFPHHGVAVTPWQSGYRLGSTLEFAGYDETLPPTRLEYLRTAARDYLLDPYTDRVEEEWFGWRPMTPDGKPIIDRSPLMQNVVMAAGHNMLGMSMAPATGKLVAELFGAGPAHIDPAPYRADRF